jgi:carbohydrate-selective porin OprB
MSVSKSQPFDESRGAGAHFLARFAEASVSEPNTSPVHKLCRRGLVIVLGR